MRPRPHVPGVGPAALGARRGPHAVLERGAAHGPAPALPGPHAVARGPEGRVCGLARTSLPPFHAQPHASPRTHPLPSPCRCCPQENVPGALRTLPLLYLRVQLPAIPDRHPLQDEQWEDLRDAAGELVYNATPECAYALWAGRDTAAKTLPERCARALPTLKFFVLGDEGQPYGYTEAQEARIATGEDEDEDEKEKDDLDADLNVSTMLEEPDDYSYEKRWSSDDQFGVRAWRIAREDGECRLQRLTGPEHRRLRRCLDGCFDGQDVVHGEHSSVGIWIMTMTSRLMRRAYRFVFLVRQS